MDKTNSKKKKAAAPKEESQSGMNRRDFLCATAAGLTSFMILPSWKVDGVRIAPSDRVVLGFVGLGRQGISDFHSFSSCPGCRDSKPRPAGIVKPPDREDPAAW